jgi:hypothetical protein
MTTQTHTKTAMIALPSIFLLTAEPVCASSRDYGFDFDQEELAEALHAPLPTSLATKRASEMGAEEFVSESLLLSYE